VRQTPVGDEVSFILDMNDDILPFLGIDCSSAEMKLLFNLRKWVESQARSFVGHSITQATITNEYQRRGDIGSRGDHVFNPLEGDRAWYDISANSFGEYLLLDNGFVRSVTEVREDHGARFGQGASDFPSGSVLTSGEDYFLELESTGMGKGGRLIRRNRDWSSQPGTIRITYVCGFTDAELNGDYSYVKLALLEDLQIKFNVARSQRSSGGGPVKKETWVGDYAVEYAVSSGSQSLFRMSPGAMAKLEPIRRIAL
jgi:hypothetical protein